VGVCKLIPFATVHEALASYMKAVFRARISSSAAPLAIDMRSSLLRGGIDVSLLGPINETDTLLDMDAKCNLGV